MTYAAARKTGRSATSTDRMSVCDDLAEEARRRERAVDHVDPQREAQGDQHQR